MGILLLLISFMTASSLGFGQGPAFQPPVNSNPNRKCNIEGQACGASPAFRALGRTGGASLPCCPDHKCKVNKAEPFKRWCVMTNPEKRDQELLSKAPPCCQNNPVVRANPKCCGAVGGPANPSGCKKIISNRVPLWQ